MKNYIFLNGPKYKLERVLNKNLESSPSAMFPKLWNAIEIDHKETKSAKIFKQRVINIYLENYERFFYNLFLN